MSFWKRLGRVIKANLNSLVSKAEDPEKILEQVIVDMREQLQEAKRQVALAIADEKRLKKQWTEEEKQSEAWESKAMRAVQLNDDELARAALQRKSQHDETASEYQKQWEIQKEAVDKLKNALHLLNQKIEEASRKKNLLLARKKRVEAQQTIQNTVSGLTDHSAFDTLDRMTNKIEEMEAQVEAGHELNLEMQSQDLESRFRALEGQNHTVEDALSALKAKMASGAEAPKEAAKELVKEKEKELAMRDEDRW